MHFPLSLSEPRSKSVLNTSVAVRALCEFTARQGDLDLRFTPSATALEGMTGHAMVTARRGAGYESEVTLACEFEGLKVRGRADGYDAESNTVEEIKTFRGDLDAMPDNRRSLHWAQAKVYGWMLCRKLGLTGVNVSLVYFDVASQLETVLTERHAADDLRQHFEDQCRRYAAWAWQEAAHREGRDAALMACRFPHADFRPGQRQLSEAVYKAAAAGRCLAAQAPTGIGKTVGTLFPLLKAMPGQGIDKALYLTAKGPGRALAFDALKVLGRSVLPIRALELVARDKACEHPGKACHGDACPLAAGFYDRLPAARADAAERTLLDGAVLREVAASHRVCPYYLGQEMVRWSDLIVGDYNYWFDTTAMLYGMTLASEWKVGVLVDEAHNLVERARKMYSAALLRSDLKRLASSAPAALRAPLSRLHRAWSDMESLQIEKGRASMGVADASFSVGSADAAYAVHDAVPESLASALQQGLSAIGDYLSEQPAASLLSPDSPLLRWYFDALHFARLLDSFGEHSLLELEIEGSDGEGDDSTLRLRNVVPAPFLKPRLAAAHTATLFSATLSPTRYYRDLLGLPPDTLTIDVPSPFNARQLSVELVGSVSTRFDRRADSLLPIADVIASQYKRQPGNYIAFFSSFDYLRRAASLFESLHPDVPTWQQMPQMNEADRVAFVQRFQTAGRGVAFAVLGGAFGEGIDLPGTRLVGAFIATLGLPPLNAANEQIRNRMEAMFGAGYDYTYLYPGLTKVVQAAGRVIRGPLDRGTIHLIDERYSRPDVQALLPSWWKPTQSTQQTGKGKKRAMQTKLSTAIVTAALLAGCSAPAKQEATTPAADSPRANATVRQAIYVEAAAPTTAPAASAPQASASPEPAASSRKGAPAKPAKPPVLTVQQKRAAAVASAASAAKLAAADAERRAALAALTVTPGYRYVYVIELDAGPMRTLRFETDQGFRANDRVLVISEEKVVPVR